MWDPSLAFVMASAVAINLVTFNYTLRKVEKPLVAGESGKFCVPPRGLVDLKLVSGAAIFGLGWGLAGLCPGPGVIVLFSMTEGIIWVIALALGQISYDLTYAYLEKRDASKFIKLR